MPDLLFEERKNLGGNGSNTRMLVSWTYPIKERKNADLKGFLLIHMYIDCIVPLLIKNIAE